MVGVEAKYVKLSFHVEKENQFKTAGLWVQSSSVRTQKGRWSGRFPKRKWRLWCFI